MTSTQSETLPGARKVARVMMTFCLVIGIGLVILAGLMVFSYLVKQRAAREQTALPLKLQAGETARTQFKTLAAFPLHIDLTLDRHQGVTDEAIEKALLEFSKNGNIGWVVQEKGVALFSGFSTNASTFFSGAADSRSKSIGYFKPPHRGSYDLIVTVNSNLPGLESARPRLIIKPFAGYGLVFTSFAMIIAIILAVSGFYLILLARREQHSVASQV